MSTDHERNHQTGYTIREAASILGVSENAVRQRIKRGTLEAVKVAGRWRVSLPDHYTDPEPTMSSGHQATTTPTSTPAIDNARMQLESIRDEWLQPLVDQLRDLEREVGRLEQERDDLRRRIEELEHVDGPRPRWWRFWRR